MLVAAKKPMAVTLALVQRLDGCTTEMHNGCLHNLSTNYYYYSITGITGNTQFIGTSKLIDSTLDSQLGFLVFNLTA